MAARRSARPHKRAQHESSDDEFDDGEKALTSADMILPSQPVGEDDEKTAKIQEKNRRAQRKYASTRVFLTQV